MEPNLSKEIMELLPEGAQVIRSYNSFENNELRLVVKLKDNPMETRYVVHKVKGKIELEHRL